MANALTHELEADLRNDARERFKGPLWEDYTFEHFKPAYLLGVELAGDSRFNATNLPQLDARAQESWQGEYPFNWDNMKEAIEFGFARARVA